MLMLEMLKVKIRLRTTKKPIWEASWSSPRSRATRNAGRHQPEDPARGPDRELERIEQQGAEGAGEDGDGVDAGEARGADRRL